MMVVVGAMALPWHAAMAWEGERDFVLTAGHWWLGVCTLFGLGVGALAVFLPLRAGAWALQQMEF
jgi:hypothetical protein